MRLSPRNIAILSLTALALTGCKKQGVDLDHASVQQVAAAVGGQSPAFEPGRWESTMQMERMDVPGMPPQAQAMMQQSSAMAHKITICLTPEEAAKPGGKFFGQGMSACVYDHFSMDGGKLDATMTCNRPGQKTSLTMNGTYASDQYQVHTTSQATMPGGQTMSVAMTVTSHRVGDCTGTETTLPK